MNKYFSLHNKIKTYGLLGYPLDHSFSKAYFNTKFQNEDILAEYINLSIKNLSDFPKHIQSIPNLSGLNVTIPYKTDIIPFLDSLDEETKAIGAVNTILFNNGKTKGYNTDIYGFEMSLTPLLEDYHSKALILGTGGAAKAVHYVLNKLQIQTVFVSRTPKEENQISYYDLSKNVLAEYLLIINTTPLGTFPNVETCANINFSFINKFHLVYDLVYNPEETMLLKQAKERGAKTKNGLEMLHKQAEKSWELWNTMQH